MRTEKERESYFITGRLRGRGSIGRGDNLRRGGGTREGFPVRGGEKGALITGRCFASPAEKQRTLNRVTTSGARVAAREREGGGGGRERRKEDISLLDAELRRVSLRRIIAAIDSRAVTITALSALQIRGTHQRVSYRRYASG